MNYDYLLSEKAFILLNEVYPRGGWLTKMHALRSKLCTARLPDVVPHCAGGWDEFERFQTQYHGIPEHLIAARDHY